MWKKTQKIIIFSFLLFFFLASFVFAQTRELEVKYLEIFGFAPKTLEKRLLPDYVKYIFNFIITAAGIIAFGSLIYGGVKYLTSAGKPENLKAARNQILTAILGITILFSSYLILTTINPQLIIIPLPSLEKITFPALTPGPPPAPPAYKNYLWRITEIADSVRGIVAHQENGIKKTAQDIESLISKCDCKYTQPMCLCQKYVGGGCAALYCYSGETTQPCPDDAEIKRKQQSIIASLSEILYYRNRTIAEREDFLIEIETLKKEISYYKDHVQAEKEYLEKIEGECARGKQEKLIQNLEEIRDKLKAKENLYQELERELNQLASLVEEIATPTDRFSKLPNGIPEEDILGCLENVKEYCTGSCEGGCHDKKECAPVECKEGNPCPTDEIDSEIREIESLTERIKNACDEIIETIKEITLT